MKYWLITVSAPYVGTNTNYRAIAESNPEMELDDWFYNEAVEDLWCNYSRFVEDDVEEDIENGISEEEAWDNARADWECGCDMKVEEISKEEFYNDWKDYEIVYQESEEESREFILCMGISGSGKTTWAKQWVSESPTTRIRLNYDDIRSMLGVYWVTDREPLVKTIFSDSLNSAMDNGYDIVIDNMSNLNPKHQSEYIQLITKFNNNSKYKYEIKYQWFTTPVEECIERDSKRSPAIGEKVIKQQWKKYRTTIISHDINEMLSNQVKEDSNLPHCIIVDMDATLCFNVTGRPFYGPGASEGMMLDLPNYPIINLVKSYCDTYDCKLIILTGRNESCREVTAKWLSANYLFPEKIIMRPDNNYTSGPEQKKLLYELNIKGKYNVDFVIEDSSKVVKMYRDLGLTVLQPNEGKF